MELMTPDLADLNEREEILELIEQGKLDLLQDMISSLIKLRPEDSELTYMNGWINLNIGKYDNSLHNFRSAVEQKKNSTKYWESFISALIEGKHLTEADSYLKMIVEKGARSPTISKIKLRLETINSIKGDLNFLKTDPQRIMDMPLQNLIEISFSLFTRDKVSEARGLCKLIQSRFPHHAQNNRLLESIAETKKSKTCPKNSSELSNAQSAYAARDHTKSIKILSKLLAKYPKDVDLLRFFGAIQISSGQYIAGVDALALAIAIKPSDHYSLLNLGAAIKNLDAFPFSENLYKATSLLLKKAQYVRPINVINHALNLIRASPYSRLDIQVVMEDWAQSRLLVELETIYHEHLLCQALTAVHLVSAEFELYFTRLRKCLLHNSENLPLNDITCRVISTLAIQCYLNEYIYDSDVNEEAAIESLEVGIENQIARGDRTNIIQVLILACYQQIRDKPWISGLDKKTNIDEFLRVHVVEPKTEIRLSKDISARVISNKVSGLVSEHYEQNPYPKWTSLRLEPEPYRFEQFFSSKSLNFHRPAFFDEQREIDILVAGCGTGQECIELASQIRNCRVLATDISLSSLAFAKRKSQEYGIKNIDFLKLDILDIRTLDRRFDLVMCSGVLHHMEEPLRGWKELTSALIDGGLMKVALYSAKARSGFPRLYQSLTSGGSKLSNSELRKFRTRFRDTQKKNYPEVFNTFDFYNLSEFRDLLVHSTEHRFDIKDIQSMLEILGLRFCGFENRKLLRSFLSKFNGKESLDNLEKWDQFEITYPKSFKSMYQFWCQKR